MIIQGNDHNKASDLYYFEQEGDHYNVGYDDDNKQDSNKVSKHPAA